MARQRVDHTMAHYGEIVAARLRELRDSRDWSMEDFLNKLAEYGVTRDDGTVLATSTGYSYEQGKLNGGADLPMNLVPVIGLIYGYKTPHGWLPDEWPDAR